MKIALIGYGKMGKMIEQIARSRGHEIVSIIDIDNQQDFDTNAFRSADVAIEFTAPQAAYGNYLKAWEQGVKVVSGSTGWMKEHGDDVRRACAPQPAVCPAVSPQAERPAVSPQAECPAVSPQAVRPAVSPQAERPAVSPQGHPQRTLFWASNFSIGVAIFSAVNRYLAKIMNQFPQYDVQMEETHHVHKLDHPSGTAITLAEEIVEHLDRKTDWEPGRVIQPDGQVLGQVVEGSSDMLRIDSRREGEVPGIHTIRYDSPEDCITITHDAHSRRGFALGAVLAAEYTKDHSGLLTISDMFAF